jgi:Protein of unknown function (DUF2877)
MRLNAALSAASTALLAAPARPVTLLGVADTAAYFELPVPAGQAPEALAIVTADAVRLPGAMVLGFSSAQRSMRQIEPRPSDRAMVGQGWVHWISRDGPVDIRAVRSWAPPRVGPAPVGWPAGVDALRAAVTGFDIGIDGALDLGAGAELALGLLGFGPGLTPAGDDLLAGALLGARAFGVAVGPLAAAVGAHAPARTTTLSARLLRHAIDGECIPEVARVIAALADPVELARRVAALLRVGHTSGAALGRGVVLAAGWVSEIGQDSGRMSA